MPFKTHPFRNRSDGQHRPLQLLSLQPPIPFTLFRNCLNFRVCHFVESSVCRQFNFRKFNSFGIGQPIKFSKIIFENRSTGDVWEILLEFSGGEIIRFSFGRLIVSGTGNKRVESGSWHCSNAFPMTYGANAHNRRSDQSACEPDRMTEQSALPLLNNDNNWIKCKMMVFFKIIILSNGWQNAAMIAVCADTHTRAHAQHQREAKRTRRRSRSKRRRMEKQEKSEKKNVRALMSVCCSSAWTRP